jgi:predicted negative regulator of RcsB-dependent stress response
LDGYSTEQEQIEAIKKWWQENGKSALLGIILGLAAIFGWRSWQSHIIQQAELASEVYQNALVSMSQDNWQATRDNAMEIINTYGNTGYVLFARLILAFIETQESNYSSAEEQLILALDETDNRTLKSEINLRLARVYIADNKLEQAMTLLNSQAAGNFSTHFNELKGDIYALQGKNEEARLAYQQALSEAESSAFDPALLNIKLNSLE